MRSVQCPLCQSESKRLYWDSVWRRPDSRVYACDNCSLLYLWPRMSPDEQRAYYSNYNTHVVQRGVTDTPETPAEGLRRCQNDQQYRSDLLLPHFTESIRILEIGAGYATFLGQLVLNGKVRQAVVVESNVDRRAFVRERYGIEGYEDLEQVGNRQFDAILMFHVLEHIDRPVEFIDNCKRLLSKQGRIIVEVPSATDPLLTLYDCSAYKNFYFQPMHPVVYSQPSLTHAMAMCGMTASHWIHAQRYGLANHLHWLRSGTPGGDTELARLLSDDLDTRYKDRLRRCQTTDTIIGIFQRTETTSAAKPSDGNSDSPG